MMSLRTQSPEQQMIGYAIPGVGVGVPSPLSAGVPGSPGVSSRDAQYDGSVQWDQSFIQLAKGLQTICRSPETSDKDKHFRSLSSPASMSPTSPHQMYTNTVTTTATATRSISQPAPPLTPPLMPSPNSAFRVSTQSDVYTTRRMPVRHMQSETKLAEKLKEICHSPREKVLPHDHQGKTACGQKLCPAHRRPSFLHHPQFLARVDIGTCHAEDLQLVVENNILHVRRRKDSRQPGDTELGSVQIPDDVDVQDIVCIIKDSRLEVSRTGRRKQPVCQRHAYSLSNADGLWSSLPDDSNPAPIIIEDKVSTDCVRLVLNVPKGYNIQQIKIQTVDDHLIIKGTPHDRRTRGGMLRSKSVDEAKDPPPTAADTGGGEAGGGRQSMRPGDVIGFTRVFELPSSWDPFSIVAELNAKHQLVIDAKLSFRCRCYTL